MMNTTGEASLREAQLRQEFRSEIMRGYQAALCNSDVPGWTLGDEVAKVADNLLAAAAQPVEPASEGECLAAKTLGITPHVCLLHPGHEGDHQWTADREYNATRPVGRRSVPGIHHAEDCPMRGGLVTTGCFCGREGERESAPGVSDEAVEILAETWARTASSGLWDQYTPATRRLLIDNAEPTARAALEAALPHLAPKIETRLPSEDERAS